MVENLRFYSLVLCACLPGLTASGQDYSPPEGYYDPAEGLLGDSLKGALHEIIDDHFVASYTTIRAAMEELDRDQANPGNILLLYSGDSIPYTATSWNREHTWPRSFGAESGPAFSDAHHLFPANELANQTRSNFAFDDLTLGSPLPNAPETIYVEGLRLIEPHDLDKGRIARAMLYMETRYDSSNVTGDFLLSDEPLSFANRMGKLTTLLQWHRDFPPDERELRRNHLIYTGFRVGNVAFFQSNRNPFIDYPDLADAVYTSNDFVTWGSWRVSNFTLPELDDEVLTGASQDPDLDRLSNLMEFSQQTDPNEITTDNLPTVDRGPSLNYFVFNRIKEPDPSGLSYSVEYSNYPLESDSWKEISFSYFDLLLADRGTHDIASLAHSPEDTSREAYYRLIVERDTISTDPVESVFDPVLFATQQLHLFTYTESFPEGWRLSDWLGFVYPESAPWFYHPEHQWIYSGSTSDLEVWFYDSSIGWFFTGFGYYPYLYSSNFGWLYYIKGSQSPSRWFLSPSTGQYISEPDLLNQP